MYALQLDHQQNLGGNAPTDHSAVCRGFCALNSHHHMISLLASLTRQILCMLCSADF